MSATPKLSVVVPVYDVEQFLDECLESIATQQLDSIEVILVNDGSTDSSPDIAESWARRDPRFTVIHQENAGLGAARNVGARHAVGEYLTFLDSDDKTPPAAYRLMTETLDETGSDFVTGNVMRFNSTRTWQAPMYEGVCSTTRLRTHVTRDHVLLKDLLAHNKVWRRRFWDDEALRFREGVLYEDLPTTIPAHLKATSVDVLADTVDLWRTREVGSMSITEDKTSDVRQVRDRLAGVNYVSDLIGQLGDTELKVEYDRQALERDVRYFVDVLPDVDSDYLGEALGLIRTFLRSVSPRSRQSVTAVHRVKYALIEAGRSDELLSYVAGRREGARARRPLRIEAGRAHLDLAAYGVRPDLDGAVTDITDDLTLRTRVTAISFDSSELTVSGWAYIDGIPASSRRLQHVEVFLSNDSTRFPLRVTTRHDHRANRDAGQAKVDYGWSAFDATMPMNCFPPERSKKTGKWKLCCTVTRSGIRVSAPIRRPEAGPATRTLIAPLSSRHEARVHWDQDSDLILDVRRRRSTVSSLAAAGGFLEIGVEGTADLRSRTVVFEPPDDSAATPLEIDLDTSGRARIALADLDALTVTKARTEVSGDGPRRLDVGLRVRDDGRGLRMSTGADLPPVALEDARAAWIHRNRYGNAVLRIGEPVPQLVTATNDVQQIELRLRYTGKQAPIHVVLSVNGRSEEAEFAVHRVGDEFTAAIPLDGEQLFGKPRPLKSGRWDIGVRFDDDTVVPLEVPYGSVHNLPLRFVHAERHHRLIDRNWHSLSLVIEPPLRADESGAFNQRYLKEDVHRNVRSPRAWRRPVVLYESFNGRTFGDSPQALFHELTSRGVRARHLIVSNDLQVAELPGSEIVQKDSREYVEALARATVIVNNTHLPDFFSKRRHQLVVQTWHGIGLKRLGLDIETVQFANPRYIEKLRQESKTWDLLISPNEFSSPILRRALDYDGELLEFGAPRNDLFFAERREEIAREVRRRLGITDDQRVVLYAPTWRDNLYHRAGQYRLDLQLDFQRLVQETGSGTTFLFRSHANVVDRLPTRLQPFVTDVSRYPDVQELLLISDVLVTDYSTLMFDFAHTGRPMIFYAYDLAHYRDELRGFYFDFEADAPGPIVSTEDEVIEALRVAGSDERHHGYEPFVGRFCSWDDGTASSRVVDRIVESANL